MTQQERERVAEKIRPLVQAAVDDTSLRKVAKDIGLAHTTIKDMLAGQTPSERSFLKLVRWQEKTTGVANSEDAPASDPYQRAMIAVVYLATTDPERFKLLRAFLESEAVKALAPKEKGDR